MLIDCDTCRVRDTDCADCVISLLMNQPAGQADLSESETAAFAALAGGGLVPPLRLVPVYEFGKRYDASGERVGLDAGHLPQRAARAG